MNQDIEHLNLLSIFHYIMGGFSLLGGFITLVKLGIMFLLGSVFYDAARDTVTKGAANKSSTPDQDLQMIGSIMTVYGVIFAVICLLLIIIGICQIVAGAKLKKCTSISFCRIVAGINCIFVPLGTILGVFTFVVLGRPSVIAMFEGRSYNPPPAQYQ